jgi:hypothetical protein
MLLVLILTGNSSRISQRVERRFFITRFFSFLRLRGERIGFLPFLGAEITVPDTVNLLITDCTVEWGMPVALAITRYDMFFERISTRMLRSSGVNSRFLTILKMFSKVGAEQLNLNERI